MRVLVLGRGRIDDAGLRDVSALELDAEDADTVDLEAVIVALQAARGLKTLRLRSRLRALPPAVYELESLHELEIVDPQLPGLSSSIAQLTRLRSLRLETFHLGSLPRSIARLHRLQTLHIDSHHLCAIPGQLRELTHLRALTLLLRRVIVPDWEHPAYFRPRFEQSHDELFAILASLSELSSLTLGEPPHDGWNPEPVFRRLPESFASLAALSTLRFESMNYTIEIPRSCTMPSVRQVIMGSARFEATDTEVSALFPNARILGADGDGR